MATADTQQDRNESGFNAPLVILGGLAVLFAVYALSLFLQGGFLKAQEMEKQRDQFLFLITGCGR